MNEEQINLTARALKKLSVEEFAESFYNNLFSIQPALRLLFPDDLGGQKKKLMLLLETVIEMLDDSEKLVPFLEESGRRHALYGVREEHYETFGAALFKSFRETLGEEFTAETEAAWTRLYEVMSETMKCGARRLAGAPEQNRKNNTKENSMKIFNQAKFFIGFIFLIFIFSTAAFAQTTTFTYQGKLNDGAMAANGSYLLEFKLFDAQTVGTGTQIGATISDIPATVTNGIFTVQLDFGANAFSGADRFLEISVRRNTGESYTTLAPRQAVSSAPYSIKSKSAETAVSATNATNATNADTLDGIDSTGFVPTNTTAFIRNQTSQQTADFNVNGTGTADILNAATQFNLNGNRILSAPGLENVFAGMLTGNVNTPGRGNSFLGSNTGNQISNGEFNSFVGAYTGFSNSAGSNNSFVGAYAGYRNASGNQNVFFGANAGFNNTDGTNNSFIGTFAGRNNAGGDQNAFLGFSSGFGNTEGNNNLFLGSSSGYSNTTGNNNSFIGTFAGDDNITGSRNTIIGYDADVSLTNLSYATAIGAESRVATSNTVMLGRTADKVIAPNQLIVGNRTAGRGEMNVYSTGNADLYMEAAGATTGINFGVSPNATLFISQYDGTTYQDRLVINPNGTVTLNVLGAGGATQLCRNANNQISTCSSSLRYKTNINSFNSGLSIINRLRPITFNWKDGGMNDLGLGAEEVAAVDENLVIRNEKGEVEGVKYDRIGVVLINAVKEQQAQIEAQQKQIEAQAKQIELLKQIVCSQNPNAAVCKEEK